MIPKDWSREIAALTPFVQGTTLELPGEDHGLLSGTRLLGYDARGGCHGFNGIADGSVDAIVALGIPSRVANWVEEIAHWRRALRPGGAVALVATDHATAQGIIALLNQLGGFEVGAVRAIRESSSACLCVASRSQVAEIRNPLGSLGGRVAALASGDNEARSELYFQLGTILLQAGDPQLARQCFDSMLRIEGSNGDALFGLGMCAASAGQWAEAKERLEQAKSVDPQNQEITRWLQLADRSLAGTAQGTPVTSSV
ncbi:MAG: tetratricopeptide repeat protein [Planctomycetota bacterium]